MLRWKLQEFRESPMANVLKLASRTWQSFFTAFPAGHL